MSSFVSVVVPFGFNGSAKNFSRKRRRQEQEEVKEEIVPAALCAKRGRPCGTTSMRILLSERLNKGSLYMFQKNVTNSICTFSNMEWTILKDVSCRIICLWLNSTCQLLNFVSICLALSEFSQSIHFNNKGFFFINNIKVFLISLTYTQMTYIYRVFHLRLSYL